MNSNLLKSQMALKAKTIKQLAQDINISKNAMYRRLKNFDRFTRGEILKIIRVLDIPYDLAFEIFFESKVS